MLEKFRGLFDLIYVLDPCQYSIGCNIYRSSSETDLLSVINILLLSAQTTSGQPNGIGEKQPMNAKIKFLDDFVEEKRRMYGLFLDVVNIYGETLKKNGSYNYYTQCKPI